LEVAALGVLALGAFAEDWLVAEAWPAIVVSLAELCGEEALALDEGDADALATTLVDGAADVAGLGVDGEADAPAVVGVEPAWLLIVPVELEVVVGELAVWSLCGRAAPVLLAVLPAVSPAALGVVAPDCEDAVLEVLDPAALELEVLGAPA
jgi:hypothetical protein